MQSHTRRAVLYGTLLLVPFGVWFALMEAYVAYAPVVVPLEDPVADNVVALPNGTTLLEPRGSAGREIVDWLETHPDGGKSFEVGGDQFLGDSAELTPQSVGRVSRLATLLKAHPEVRVAIIGYSAAERDDQLSRDLSVVRAENVRDQLIQFGVPASRIIAEGRGASNPIAPNSTATSRQKNERVTVFLIHNPSESID